MCSLIRNIAADRSGGVALMFFGSMVVLMAFAGAGYDLGRQQLVKQKLQQASDEATLAASAMLESSTTAERQATAQRFFNLNYPPSYLGIPRPSPTITVNANDVTVTAHADVPTRFIRNLGVPSMNADSKTTALFKKGYNQVDMIFVMDNSGSMGLIDPGASGESWATDWDRVHPYFMDYNLTYNMVPASYVAAYGADAYQHWEDDEVYYDWYQDSTMPSPVPWEADWYGSRISYLRSAAYHAAEKLLNNNQGKVNQIASISWSDRVMETQDFSSDMKDVDEFVFAKMWPQRNGGTNSTTGLQKALDMGYTNGGFRPGAVHAVILFTDGGNNNNKAPGNAQVNAASLALCQQLKDKGTLVYTVAFGAEVNDPSYPLIKPFLSDCASKPNGPPDASGKYPNEGIYYFLAKDADALTDSFNTIVTNLQKLRITQ